METNNPTPPPGFGNRSYAEMIKQRLIYGRFYAGWSVQQGRYFFRVMYSDRDAGRHNGRREVIGYEMVAQSRYVRTNIDNAWVLRVYLDGTALYRPYMLGWLRYNTMRPIRDVMDYFFYKEAEVRENAHNRIHILRRKPINPHHIAPIAKGFGEFLTNKYNHGEGM